MNFLYGCYMTKFIRIVFSVLMLVVLSACGGGGGSPGRTSGAALFTTAADKVQISPGETKTFSVGGGVPSYTATSNSGAASVSLNGNVLSIVGGGGGTATIVVKDAGGTAVSIEVTVGSGLDLYTTAPSAVTIGVGASSSVYNIGGGSLIYDVTSSNRQIATISRSGNTFVISGVASGKATASVKDSLGKAVSIDITVGSSDPLFTTAPSAVTIGVGATSSVYTIGGGSQNYDVVSSNKQVATVGRSGNTFIITGVAGGKATVSVKDSLGAALSIDVIVGSSDDMFTTAASDITLAVGAANTYKIGGGSTPYSAGSSNLGVATVSVSGSDLIISAVAEGSATVVVRDAVAGKVEIKVTVGSGVAIPLFTTSASVITIAPATAPTFKIGGGKAPYSVSTSNSSVITSTVSGTTLTVNAIALGSANLIVTDLAGAFVNINVTVAAGGSGVPVPLFTTAPPAVSLATASAPVYTIGGGTGPYSAVSSDVKIAASTVLGTNLTITGVGPGTANVVVSDSVGATKTIVVTVTATTSITMAVTPASATGYQGDILTFRVDGGTAPYSVISNIPAIATVTSGSVLNSAGTFTVFLAKVTAGVSVVVADANGNTQTISITVGAQVSNLFLSPVQWTINETNNSVIPLTITGGNGPFQVFTSSTTLSSVTGTSPDALNPLTFNGRTVNVGLGSNANRCVALDTNITLTVIDSLNKSTTSTMTIRDLSTAVPPVACP